MGNPTNKFTTSTTGATHEPPVAILARNRLDTVIGSIIQLDGRKSYDPENRPLTFHWSFTQVPLGSEVVTQGFRPIRPTTSAVAFTPDKVGLYVIQLVVNDGDLDSDPVSCTVNIQISRVPVGESIIPDAYFLWSYISNFWQLVEDREVITSMWSSVIQLIGAEIIKLWSHDYNKSLKTIQSTTQRRWLKYDTHTSTIGDVQQRVIVGKTSDGTNGSSGTLGAVPGVGYTSTLYVPFGTGAGEADFSQLEGNYGVKGRVICVNGEGYTISNTKLSSHDGTDYSLVTVDEEAIPDGVVGATWRVPHLLHTPNIDLEEDGVRAGDVVVFEVKRADSNILAELRAQVVCVDRHRLGFEFTLEDLETGSDTIDRTLFRQLVQDLRIAPVNATDLSISATAESLISFIPPGVNLAERPFTPYRVTLKAKKVIHNKVLVASDDVVSVPALQEQVVEPPVVLRENLDYIVESGAITFISGLFKPSNPAPDQFWAENTVLDNAPAIENNFGLLVGLGRDDLTEKQTQAPYLSAVKGLMFAYTNGPTVANIRLGVQILMGLPFTEERGVIVELTGEYSTSSSGVSLGRILIEDIDDKNVRLGFRRLYFYPTEVGVEDHPLRGDSYRVGDVVEAFRPLSKGIEVLDYVKDPDWWVSALGGLEILKYFTFKVTLDQLVFNDNDAGFALEFIRLIKPAYTKVITTILSQLEDEIEVTDITEGKVGLNFYNNYWGLEATNRSEDDNHQGVDMWPITGQPFHTRTLSTLRDLTTYEDGGQVKVQSATGWGTDYIRARHEASIYRGREGDLLFIHQGQQGASTTAPGVYEIFEVTDENNLILGWAASPGPFSGHSEIGLDASLFPYGSDLTASIMRREVNPVVMGEDLLVTVPDLADSATANFLKNAVSPGDHLVIEQGPNRGEFIIDAVTPATLPTESPEITDTQVRLKVVYSIGGHDALVADGTERPYRVIRPILQWKNVKYVRTYWDVAQSVLFASQYPNSGDMRMDRFSPSMVGMRVQVTNAGDPANNGVFTVTAYRNPGEVETDNPNMTNDPVVADGGYPGEAMFVSELPAHFERVTEYTPTGICEFSMVGDDVTAVNRLNVIATNQLAVAAGYTPQGSPNPWPYTLAGPANIGTNPVQLGFLPGDKLKLVALLSGPGTDEGRVLTLVDPSTITVLENDLTVDASIYKFEVFRRLSV